LGVDLGVYLGDYFGDAFFLASFLAAAFFTFSAGVAFFACLAISINNYKLVGSSGTKGASILLF